MQGYCANIPLRVHTEDAFFVATSCSEMGWVVYWNQCSILKSAISWCATFQILVEVVSESCYEKFAAIAKTCKAEATSKLYRCTLVAACKCKCGWLDFAYFGRVCEYTDVLLCTFYTICIHSQHTRKYTTIYEYYWHWWLDSKNSDRG